MLNAHWETIIPSMFFKVNDVAYDRERLELDDGDFLDVDWLSGDQKRCVVLSHGLEGGSDRYYIKRAARYFHRLGWEVAAWNCRSCSGEMNRLPRFYHHGDTDDLDVVVKRALEKGNDEVVLIGFSMGGSMSLKYLGEQSRDSRIKGAVVFSVPCNLRDSAEQLLKKENKLYEQRFLKKLIVKIRQKSAMHQDVSVEGIDTLKDFDLFHELYTAPLHGFSGRDEFFDKATCDKFLKDIKVPVLIVNAENDPMLGEACYPRQLARASRYVHLETPKVGGHVGFTLYGKPYSYMEKRAEDFIRSTIL